MKFFALLSLVFLVAFSALAQPVLGPSFGPTVGGRFTFRYANTANYNDYGITEGANRTWAFAFDRFDSNQISYVDAASTPYASDFTAATIASFAPGVFPSYGYFLQSTTGIYSVGTVTELGASVIKSYNEAPYSVLMPFGLTFGNTQYDSVPTRSVSASATQRGYKNDTISYVGYGLLIVNGRRYSNAIMIREKYVNRDTNGVQTSRGVIESWFVTGYGYPVVTMEVFTNTQGVKRAAPSYIVNFVASARPTAMQALSVYPNPAIQKVRLQGYNAAQSDARVVSATGTVQNLPIHQGEIDIEHLTPGVYWVEQGNRRSRLVKQ